jgi:predicted DNA-binding transcriptional regulator AlpA
MSTPTHDTPSAKRERRKPVYVPLDPLLNPFEAAMERGQAISTFWRDVASGRVPAPFYPSPRCPRWRRSEIRAGVEATRAQPKETVR